MGGSAKQAKMANQIAMMQLSEQQRQYNEQKAKEKAKKDAAQSNALGSRKSANMAYSNNFNQATDFTTGQEGNGYSLLTAGGTPSVIGTLLGGDQQNTTLG